MHLTWRFSMGFTQGAPQMSFSCCSNARDNFACKSAGKVVWQLGLHCAAQAHGVC